MFKNHRTFSAFASGLCLVLLALGLTGCDNRPTAVATFQVATASANTGDKALDDAVNASLQPMMDYDFKSAAAIEQAARDLRLANPLPQTLDGSFTTDGAAAWRQIIQKLTASITLRSETAADGLQTVSISMRTDDPRLAPRFVNRLVDNYLAQARTLADEALLEQKKIATAEVDRLRKRVNELEVEILKAKLNGESADESGRQLEEVREQLDKWSERLRTAQMALTLSVGERGTRFKFIERAPDHILRPNN